MDKNKYLASHNVSIKQEVEDSSEVPTIPPSITHNFILSNPSTYKEILKTHLPSLEKGIINHGMCPSPSTLTVNTIYPGLGQENDTLQVPSTLHNSHLFPSRGNNDTQSMIQNVQNLPADIDPPLSLVSATLPTVGKVAKPKKRAKKRYVYSKPKRRSKKKTELPALPLPETSDGFPANLLSEFNVENDTDGSSDTILLEEDEASTISTEQPSNAGEKVQPPELKSLLINRGVVNLLSNNFKVSTAGQNPNTANLIQGIPKTANEENLLTDEFGITNVDTTQNSEFIETVFNEMPKRKKAAAKKKPRKKNNAAMYTELANAEILNSSIIGSELNATFLEPAKKGKSKKVSTPKKSKKKNVSVTPQSLNSELLHSGTVSSELNVPLGERVLKLKKVAKPRKSPKKNITVAVPTTYKNLNFLDITDESGELVNTPLSETVKKPPNKKKVTNRRKSPKKKIQAAVTAEDIEYPPNPLETFPPKRKRASPKKKTADKNLNSIVEASLLDKSQVVESCLVVSIKQELNNTEPFHTPISDYSTNPDFGSDNANSSNLTGATIVSLSFEEDVPKEDGADLLDAFKQRNAKGRFIKSPKSSNTCKVSKEEKSTDSSSNHPDNMGTDALNTRMIDKTLSPRYISNCNATQTLYLDPVSTNLSSYVSSNTQQLQNNEGQKLFIGLSSNLNIKEEPVDTTEHKLTTDNSSAQQTSTIQIPKTNFCSLPIISSSNSVAGEFTSAPSNPTGKRKQTARRGRRGTSSKQLPSSISISPPSNQSFLNTADVSVTDFTSIPSASTVKKKQVARRGKRGTPTRQQPSRMSTQPTDVQSISFSLYDSSVSDSLLASSVPLIESSDQTPKKNQTARRGKKKTKTAQIRSIETTVNSLDIPFAPEPIKTLIPENPSSSATILQTSNANTLSEPSNTCTSSITIKTEPKDPEYEVITLDDSPVKNQTAESALQFPPLETLPQVSSMSTSMSIKEELCNHPEESLAMSGVHSSTSRITPNMQPNMQPNLINNTFPDTLSSSLFHGTMEINSTSNRMSTSISPLTISSRNNNLKTTVTQTSTTPPADFNSLKNGFLSFIKTEMQDNSETKMPTLLPIDSPSFTNYLNPANVTSEIPKPLHEFPFSSNFTTVENPIDSSKTHSELQRVLKSCTDAVYSSSLSEEIIPDESRNKNISVDNIRHSTEGSSSFGDGVSLESLKRIIDSSHLVRKETASSSSVFSIMDRDSTFTNEDEETSSQASSFLSRSSPRLSTPHSDCVSLRLTDSASPLTKLPDTFGKAYLKDSHCKEAVAMDIDLQKSTTQSDEDDCEGLTIKNVGLKLRFAANLAQNAIYDANDCVPFENYPVVDGEVECFHRLLLAAFVPKVDPEESLLKKSDPEMAEKIICDETYKISNMSTSKLEVNRSFLLDQFISKKMAEENSLKLQEQNELFYRRSPEKSATFSSFDKSDLSINSFIAKAKKDSDLKSYASNASDNYAMGFEPSRPLSKMEIQENVPRIDYYTYDNVLPKTENAVQYVPSLEGQPTYKDDKSIASCIPPSKESAFCSTLPSSEMDQKPGLDVNLMLKLITNVQESACKNIPDSKLPSKSSTIGNIRKAESSLMGEDFKFKNISTPSVMQISNTFPEIPESLSSQSKVDNSNYSSQTNNENYLNDQNCLFSGTLANFSLPSKELLSSVIKNSQFTTKDSNIPLLNKEQDSVNVDASNLKKFTVLSEGGNIFHSDIHKDLTTSVVTNLNMSSTEIKSITGSEASFIKTVDNSLNSSSVPNSQNAAISKLAERISTLFPNTSSTFGSKDMVAPEPLNAEHIKSNSPLPVGPVKSNTIGDNIDVNQLLNILNTAKSLPSNNTTSSNSQFNETFNPEHEVSSSSTYHNDDYDNFSAADSRYSYPENFTMQYPNYTIQPIVHEYDHKPRNDPCTQGSVLEASAGVNKTINISIPAHSKDSNASDSDVDNEHNVSEQVDDSGSEDHDDKEQPNDKDAKGEEPHDFPKYKSRWERIMERKNQDNARNNLNDHLVEDYYSVKVPKSKPNIQKPIAHVQPCSQSASNKKQIEKKAESEKPGLPLIKKTSNKAETSSSSGLPNKKKTIIFSENPSGPPLKKSKTNIQDISVKKKDKKHKSGKTEETKKHKSGKTEETKKHKSGKTEDIATKKKKAENIVDSNCVPPLKKLKCNDKVNSPKTKKSKESKTHHKKQSPNKQVVSESPSDLFTPDKLVKSKDVKKMDAKKLDDEASKRLYGRVTNRGSFLTESSVKPPPKHKAPTGKLSSEKAKSSKILSEEFHSMINTPEIKIGLENEVLQTNSHKLSFEAYKMKKSMHNCPNTETLNTKVNFFSNISSSRQIPSSSNMLSHLSPDISFQVSSDSSDFYSPSDPFSSDKTNQGLQFEGVSRNPLLTSVNTSSAVKTFPYTKRTLLPDPVSSFKQNSFTNDFEREVRSPQIASFLPSTSTIESPSPSHNLIQHPVLPVSNFAPQPVPPVTSLIPQPVASLVAEPAPSRKDRLQRSRQTRCVCLPPKTLKASVGSAVFETFNVLLLILEWNVDWLVQQQKCLEPPPISNRVKDVINKYVDLEEYYNTYLPLLLLETWQRIYSSWTRLHQAAPYFCKITSYSVEKHNIKVECEAIFKSSYAEKGLVPEVGNIIMIKFGTKEKGGIKILGYVTSVNITADESKNTSYQTLKYTADEVMQRLSLTFLGAYDSEDFDKDQCIRIQVLSNIKSILKQNDAMFNIKSSPLYTNVLNPLNDGLRTVNVITRNANPLKDKDSVNECVRDIIRGILSPHPLPLLTIAKSLPSSDRLSVLLPLIEKMKHSYKTKVLLCTRTAKALNDIGFYLEGGSFKVVIIDNPADVHQKLKKYFLDHLAIDKANSCLPNQTPEIPGFQPRASREAIERAKMDLLKECDVILSNIRSCHNDFIAQACAEIDCVPQMCCIIDEANLCTEPEILIPLLYGISKLILIGDPDVQAKVCSKTAISYGYNRSLFHRANELDIASE